MRKLKSKKMAIGMLATVMALSIALPGTAMAQRAGSSGDKMGASWTVPTKPMTDTVEKDGKLYKVITTWNMAWSTSGPDFLGLNNSSFYGNGGNGNANVTTSKYGATSTLLGVWASKANEEPNAFNWNTWYNLYADEQSKGGVDTAKTDLVCTTDSWDTTSGVWGPFKYRPEIIWLCNNLSAAQTSQYVGYINNGKYYTGDKSLTTHEETTTGRDGKETKTTVVDDVAVTSDTDKPQYYVEGDETYDPLVIQPVNTNAYTFVESTYELATYADQVIATTESNGGTYGSGSEKVTKETVDWKNMNALPRSNRYTESPQQCALNIERLARGSVYYTLKQINDNEVKRKKVAFVSTNPGVIDDTHVAVTVYDYTEDIMGNGQGGAASWSPLVVNQLGQDGKLDVYNNLDHAVTGGGVSTGENTSVQRPTMTYSQYIADANDLALCDIIYAPNVTYSVAQWQDFLTSNVTTKAARNAVADVEIYTNTPFVCNGSNYTMDKLIYGAYAMDCFYPELFPNMECSTYWYNKVYHIKSSALNNALTWAFATATLPKDSGIKADGYEAEKTVEKFNDGLAYFNSNKDSDETLKRVGANTTIDGKTSVKSNGKDTTLNFANFAPSALWLKAGTGNAPTASVQGIEVKSSFNKKLSDGTFKLDAKNTQTDGGALTYKSSNEKVATVAADGTVTLKDGGTTYITVTAADTDKYASVSRVAMLAVTAEKQTVSFEANDDVKVDAKGKATITKTIIDDDFTVKATSKTSDNKEGGTVTYESSNEKVATINKDTGEVTIEGIGTATITASAEKKDAYSAASATATITVERCKQEIAASDVQKKVGDADFTLDAKVSATPATAKTGTLSYASDNDKVATVDKSGKVTLVGAGTATITVTASATLDCAKVTKDVKVTVDGLAQTVTADNATKTYGDAAFNLNAKTSGDGALSYASSNDKVASVDASGNVTVKGAGEATITVSAANTTKYNAATKKVTVKVNKAANAVTLAKATKTVKLKKVKKKAQTVAGAAAKNATGAVTYSISKVNKSKKNFSINKKTGKITVKKGTYKVTVKATAAGDANHASGSATAVVTVKVK